MKTPAAVSMVTGGGALVATTLPVELFGVPLSVLLAGFMGSVVALAFLPQMTRRAMFVAVAIGTICAAFLTLFIAHLGDLPEKVHGGIAFLIGLGAQMGLTWAFTRSIPWLEKKFGGPQ